jgi:hypothetical protein
MQFDLQAGTVVPTLEMSARYPQGRERAVRLLLLPVWGTMSSVESRPHVRGVVGHDSDWAEAGSSEFSHCGFYRIFYHGRGHVFVIDTADD